MSSLAVSSGSSKSLSNIDPQLPCITPCCGFYPVSKIFLDRLLDGKESCRNRECPTLCDKVSASQTPIIYTMAHPTEIFWSLFKGSHKIEPKLYEQMILNTDGNVINNIFRAMLKSKPEAGDLIEKRLIEEVEGIGFPAVSKLQRIYSKAFTEHRMDPLEKNIEQLEKKLHNQKEKTKAAAERAAEAVGRAEAAEKSLKELSAQLAIAAESVKDLTKKWEEMGKELAAEKVTSTALRKENAELKKQLAETPSVIRVPGPERIVEVPGPERIVYKSGEEEIERLKENLQKTERALEDTQAKLNEKETEMKTLQDHQSLTQKQINAEVEKRTIPPATTTQEVAKSMNLGTVVTVSSQPVQQSQPQQRQSVPPLPEVTKTKQCFLSRLCANFLKNLRRILEDMLRLTGMTPNNQQKRLTNR